MEKAFLKNPQKFALEDEFHNLDDKLDKVISNESSNSQVLKNQIKELEHDIFSFKDQDSHLINQLKFQIKHLESELHKADNLRSEEVNTNVMKIDNIGRDIGDLRNRFHDYIVSKNDRDLRIATIENKIKQKVGRNYDEIIKLENHLKLLEEKLAVVKTKHSGSIIQIIEDKISNLKKKLIMKKAGVDLPKIKISPSVHSKTLNLPVPRHNLAIVPIDSAQTVPVLPPPPKPVKPKKFKLPFIKKKSKVPIPIYPPSIKHHNSVKYSPPVKKSINLPKLPPLPPIKHIPFPKHLTPKPIHKPDLPSPPPFLDDKLRALISMEPAPEKISFFDKVKHLFHK